MGEGTPAAQVSLNHHHTNQEQGSQTAQESQPPRWSHQTAPTNGPTLGHRGKPCHTDVRGRPTHHRQGRPNTVFGSIATASCHLGSAAAQLNATATPHHGSLLNVRPRQHRTRGKCHQHEHHAKGKDPGGRGIGATNGFMVVGHAQVLPHSSIGCDGPTAKVLLRTHILWGDSMPRRSKPSDRTLRTKSHNLSREACTAGSSAFKTEHCW